MEDNENREDVKKNSPYFDYEFDRSVLQFVSSCH